MKFNFFQKSKKNTQISIKVSRDEGVFFAKEEFDKLAKRHLAIPITLFQL